MSAATASAELSHPPWCADPHWYATHVSSGSWLPYDWLCSLGEVLSDTVRAGNGRLVVNAPPRHGKSELVSTWAPVWFLHNYPDRRVILVSYGAELATMFGRRARQLLYHPDCDLRLVQDVNRQHEWETPQGGGLYAAGVTGSLVGRGGDLIIVDDPIKNWEEARSITYQHRLQDLFRSTLLTRLEPDASIVVVMQRWTETDLTGWLMREHEDDWTLRRFPAEAEPDDPLGRPVGAPLCPERYDAAALARLKVEVADAWWPCYQQDPRPAGAGRAYTSFGPWNIREGVELDSGLPLCLGLDFNSNPGMHGIVGQYADAADRFLVSHVLHGPRMPIYRPQGIPGATPSLIDELGRLIQEHGGFRWPELWIFGDATGSSTWPGTSESCYDVLAVGLNEQLGLRGKWRQRVPRSNPGPPDRIAAVNHAARGPDDEVRLQINPRCQILTRDLERVNLDERGAEDQSVTELTHASAALGYWIHYLRPARPRYDPVGGRMSVGVRR